MERPKRRWDLQLTLGANSLEDLEAAFDAILFDIHRKMEVENSNSIWTVETKGFLRKGKNLLGVKS